MDFSKSELESDMWLKHMRSFRVFAISSVKSEYWKNFIRKKKKLIPRNTRPMRLSLELKFLMTTTVQVQGIYILKLAKEKVNEGTGELNRFIKCFLHNRENPSSTPELTLKDRHSKKNMSSQDSGVRDGRISGAH